MKKPQRVTISVLTCRQHGNTAIAVGDRRTGGGKCCGTWIVTKSWQVDVDTLLDDITAAIEAAP